jgi:hypothetical protein
MPSFTTTAALAVPVGILATLAMDGVVSLRKRIWGVTTLDYRLVGRWIGHLLKGRFSHDATASSAQIRGETILGWVAHYMIGVVFAAGLIAIGGWEPSLGACLLTGLLTSAAPFLILQPGMGRGIAASKAPQPNLARLNTLITHLTFGAGLYLGVRIWSALA